MQIETAEKLKSELTDQYVVVEEGIAELRRFVGRTGRVKTVNMNGRAVVEFDGGEDIGWYDIAPTYLKVVDKPEPKPKKEAVKETAKATPSAKKKSAGLSPLEQARQQGAGGKTAAPAAKKKSAGLSPLEQARQQGAGGAKPKAASKPAAASKAKTKSKKPAASGKKLSPLEQARMQDSMKDSGAAKIAKPETSEPEVAEEIEAEEPAAEESPSTPSTGADDKSLSPLERARLQGPFKG